jgi:hypothetical protein
VAKAVLFTFTSLVLAVLASGASAAAPTSGSNVRPQAAVRTLAAVTNVSGRRLVVAGSPRRRAVVRFRMQGLEGRRVVRAQLSLYSGRRSGVFRIRSAGRGKTLTAWAPRDGWARLDVTDLVRGKTRVALVLLPKSRRTRLVLARPRLAVRVQDPALEFDRPASPARPPASPLSPPPAGSPPPRPELPPVAPSVPGNPYAGRIGVASPTVWYSESDQRDYVRRARTAGMAWIREDFHWGAFERSPGVWNWEVGDRMMRTAAVNGVNVLGTVAYSADWASSGPTIYHPPRDPAAYANFCRRLVERYGPGGTFWRDNPSLTPRPLTALEIWNEPWLHSFWRPNPDPAGYVRLLRAAATAIRAADPRVRVLASADVFQMRSDTSESRDWFRLLLAEDAGVFRNLVDAYSVHLYTEGRAPLDLRHAQRWRFDRAHITRDLATAAGAAHPLWVTEFGWSTYPGDEDSVSEAEQALYTRQALDAAFTAWPRGEIELAFLYYWGKVHEGYVGGYSALRADGSTKPVWSALTALLAAA